MPGVYIEKPDSFKLYDFFNAYVAANGLTMFALDPEGYPAEKTHFNVPAIGISTYDRSKDVPLGYRTGKVNVKERESNRHKYQADAIIDMEMDPKNLPQGIEGESWALQVRLEENIPLFQPLAIALAEYFGVNIFITPAQASDPDPDHLEEEPANPNFPDVMKMCPIIIRKVDQVK